MIIAVQNSVNPQEEQRPGTLISSSGNSDSINAGRAKGGGCTYTSIKSGPRTSGRAVCNANSFA